MASQWVTPKREQAAEISRIGGRTIPQGLLSMTTACSFLARMRRDVFDFVAKLRMNAGVHRPVFDLGARGVLAKKIIPLPVFRRPDRPCSKAAAAVRANILQNLVYTRRAKRAFVRANARFQ